MAVVVVNNRSTTYTNIVRVVLVSVALANKALQGVSRGIIDALTANNSEVFDSESYRCMTACSSTSRDVGVVVAGVMPLLS